MRRVDRFLIAGSLAFAPACYTGLGDGAGASADAGTGTETETESAETGSPPPPELECEGIGLQPLRRISSKQYELILRDLLPEPFLSAALDISVFPQTAIVAGFSTYASANTVSTNESYAIEDNAEFIAAVFHENQAQFAPVLIPCLPSGYAAADIDACLPEFVADFGTRAFRRPPTETETELILDLYAGIKESDGAQAGLTAVVQYFLQAPALLYVTERVDGTPGDYVALAPSELAARLSLLFINAAPDDELLAAVAEGRLHSKEDVEREARRLLDEPEAKRAFAHFHHEWLRGFKLETSDRDHPEWNDSSSAALREELGLFAEWFLDETDGSFTTLMTTEAFPPDDRLQSLYGVEGGGARHGLLTTAAAMAAQADTDSTSLIGRGAFIRNQVLCIPAPSFPGDLDIETPLEDHSDLPTARERLQPLVTLPQCAGCHAAINPLGYPFEVYDWAGAHRTTENGATIDVSTDIALGSLSGSFADAVELLDAIAATEEARDCYATQWFRYSLGRAENDEDDCALDAITEAFEASDGDVRELLVAIAVSDAFRFRKIGGGQ